MKTRRSPRQLKLGNIYVIDFNDHFSARRVTPTDPGNLQPVVLREVGRLVAITPLQYNLEHAKRLGVPDDDNLHDIHGIMRSCIIRVHDLGPAPQEP